MTKATEFLADTFKAIGTVVIAGETVEVGHADQRINKLVGHRTGKIVRCEAVRDAHGIVSVRRGIAQNAIKLIK